VKLEGIHHITAITADAPRNVDFYARILGLRLVKKTVNQDDPTVYHLFYADEQGSAGADLTFFEYPGLPLGRAGAGMVHRIAHRVASAEAIDFWEERLRGEEVAVSRVGDVLRFPDPEGLEHELLVAAVDDPPLTARSLEVPEAFALQGFDHVRAYTADAARSAPLLRDVLGFEAVEEPTTWEARGDRRGGRIVYDPATERGRSGAGTVHHIAWASLYDELEEWQRTVERSGAHPTPIIDRFYFRSVYFREPSGVLFELASIGPGFTADEPAETLGEGLSLPPRFEPLRDRLAERLTPLPDTRPWRPAADQARTV
jgi:glyoxalase family protein